jgi:hypothetical protein
MSSDKAGRGRGGRPRIFSKEEAAASKRESNRLSRLRKRQPAGPADFIAYEPLLPDVPTETPPRGLRTSPDIAIPPDDEVEEDDVPPYHRLISPPPTQKPVSDADAEVAAQIKKIQIDEQGANAEQSEYEVRIIQRLDTLDKRDTAAAEILLGLRAGAVEEGQALALRDNTLPTDYSAAAGVQEIDGLHTAGEGDIVYDEEPLHSCFPQSASVDEPIMTQDNDSIARSSTSNRPASIPRSRESTVPSQQTPQRAPSLQSGSSQRRTSRRSTPFPPQKNTLMSWIGSLPQYVLEDINHRSPPTVLHPSPSNASPSPSSPAPLMIRLSPAPIIPPPSPVTTVPTATAPDTAASPVPTEKTALKLAKQLRNFQGCTHEQHREADRLHQEHHRRPDVHSACSSLAQITGVLRGDNGGAPLPDVLSSPKLMKPADINGLDCRAAFEGSDVPVAPQGSETRDEHLPKNLCLPQCHATSKKNRRAKVTFDIDSTCCFPSSLGVARQGINWSPKAHAVLNLTADIHFGLKVPVYNNRGALTHRYAPLHKIPHYCLGSVISMETLLLYIFFPSLHSDSDYEHSTYLSKEDQALWYDAVFSLALNKTVGSSNLMLHYPATARIVDVDSTAISAESLARKASSREQLLRHPIQPQYLDALWDCIRETIAENPGLHRFQGATLFMHAKNTKLEFIDDTGSLTTACNTWEDKWSKATDPQFYNPDRTFVDLAKQVTSEDSALPYDEIPNDHEAEVFLWKKCCLDTYSKTRTVLNADGSSARGGPKRTAYHWAMMRDTIGQTLFAAPNGKEGQEGLIYSQFYALIKTPFDTSKVYVFDNESFENLALDPGYIRSLQQEGGGITFSKAVCEFGYLHSKKRAHANLLDNRWKSYGIREEHRISLTMMKEICQRWHDWDLYDSGIDDAQGPLPYYVVPTQELLGFLYAQINKYCFLFEHTLAHTAMTYSLPETLVMVTALRALRFCYGGNLLQRESLLYKDRWENIRNHKAVVKEGLGMRDTIQRCGLGWFLPKINWATWRFAPPHGENILVGNVLMHEEYKRRWRAVKDLRDVYIRFNQAESWYERYSVQHSAALSDKWLEYLHALNLEQFDTDVWGAVLKCHKRSPELAPEAIQHRGDIRFCYHDMKRMFAVDAAIGPPHFVTGNKMRFEKVAELLDFLFLWEDGQERPGWGHKPYRVILQKSFDLIERRLGYQRAAKWLDEFFHLVRLTHWVLPYPSNATLIMSTKTSRSQGLKGRMMWFSAVYAHPEKVVLPLRSHPRTLYDILWNARRQTFGDGRDQQAWSTSQLIGACRAQGVTVYGQEEAEEYWVAGKRSAGLKGFEPVWERTRPARLEMLEHIKGKSLDELEDLIGGLSRDHAADDIQDDRRSASSDGVSSRGLDDGEHSRDDSQGRRPARAGGGFFAAFAQRSNRGDSRETLSNVTVADTVTDTSGSVFVPSASEG